MKHILLLSISICAFSAPAFAADAAASDVSSASTASANGADKSDAATLPRKQIFSTGVAKGRDVLDSAISTSSMSEDEVAELGAHSLAEVLRNIPGVRAEVAGGEGNNNYSIRGLPLAATGSKFLQIQEDGLPTLEFGDIEFFATDILLRYDASVAAIEAIRGGSASTFASNSPGGAINLISKTGKEAGGSISELIGVNYGEYRTDAEYGAPLNDTLYFHVGGFYRRGEGPRDHGYTAYRGGQIKANITKEFPGGYIRLYGKYLNDNVPSYQTVPIKVSGTNADPAYASLTNFDFRRASLQTSYANEAVGNDTDTGMHPLVKSIGLEGKLDLGHWTFTERFRYTDAGVSINQIVPSAIMEAAGFAESIGGAGATLRYANGPKAGQTIGDPAALNGNGLIVNTIAINAYDKLNNVTNDLRASGVFDVGGGKLTVTVGFYKSRQTIQSPPSAAGSAYMDLVGGGAASAIEVVNSNGNVVNSAGLGGVARVTDVHYDINAPFGSLNYHIGKFSIGASVRYDMGAAKGTLNDFGAPELVDYSYHYLSYSAGINYRISEPMAVFARYSKGGRAAADRILFTAAIDYTTGKLVDPASAYDAVRQFELGVKYRRDNIALNLTGFVASTGERNLQMSADQNGNFQLLHLVRHYKAKGAEFEGSFSSGIFRITAGATYTKAEISADASDATVIGNTPRHQAALIYEVTPVIETGRFTLGANFVGTTSSYAQDSNKLKLPGYTIVNAFAKMQVMKNLQFMVNASNLFDTVAITEINQSAIPASGIVLGRAVNGRTVSASARFTF